MPAPAPADTAAADTAIVAIPPSEVAGDTVPTVVQEAAEMEATLPDLVRVPDVFTPGWGAARWTFTRDDLALLSALTLLDVVERVPGVHRFRPGGFGRAAGVSSLGSGGGRVRVRIDGYELDPLLSASFPFETIALLDVEQLTVERTLSGLLVDVRTFRLSSAEPYSVVELGTGATQNRLLRALFSRGVGERSVLTGAFDIVSTGGLGLREDFSQSNAAFRWDYLLNDATSLDVEWRRSAQDRAGEIFPQAWTRTDLVVTGRRRISPALVVEALVGRSDASEAADSLLPADATGYQAALRGALAAGRIGVEATGRVRSRGDAATAAPTAEFEARGRVHPIAPLHLEGSLRSATADAGTAAEASALASFSPRPGLSLFGSVTAGSRLVPFIGVRPIEALDQEGEPVLFDRQRDTLFVSDVGGWRAGAEVAGRFGSLGVAAFQAGAGDLAGFGYPFDRGIPVFAAQATTGAEAYATLPVPRTDGALYLEGSYTWFDDAGSRIYTPASTGRAALVFSRSYYEGQLRPALRIEGVHRGSAIVPAEERDAFTSSVSSQSLNVAFDLQIIDVRAFLVWENALNDENVRDFPWAPPGFPRIVYGASWRFRN